MPRYYYVRERKVDGFIQQDLLVDDEAIITNGSFDEIREYCVNHLEDDDYYREEGYLDDPITGRRFREEYQPKYYPVPKPK